MLATVTTLQRTAMINITGAALKTLGCARTIGFDLIENKASRVTTLSVVFLAVYQRYCVHAIAREARSPDLKTVAKSVEMVITQLWERTLRSPLLGFPSR